VDAAVLRPGRASAFFGGDWLIYGGMATIACAALAILAAQRLERMASLSILVSAGFCCRRWVSPSRT
jgi:formate hydrogenlyase subunit 3/multisubunit Na+/H+ antiporter MnhD subunit